MNAQLGELIAQQRAEREATLRRQLDEDANRLCAFCKGAKVDTCLCRSFCGAVECGRRKESEGGMPACWLWNARALADVPLFLSEA